MNASRSRWCSISSRARPTGIGDRIAVAGQRDLGRELDRPLERLEEVAERVGTARGPEPDGRRDPPEQVVGRHEHAAP